MEGITFEGVKQFTESVGDYIEPYNFDILLGLSQLTNSIEKGYKLYKRSTFEGYSLFLKNDIDHIKKDILYRNKENLPIKFTNEIDKESFINTISLLEGEELEYYLKMNGYMMLPTGISICMEASI
ncbi:MAG: hypothetical protein E7E64_05190 [Clostridium celatum]|uniref:hypothetical protein n=1 Tax=Clostridium tertium TaxID=1559 RepID=UPI0028FDFE03|nr:hypothetical protein [Clostridium celatum]